MTPWIISVSLAGSSRLGGRPASPGRCQRCGRSSDDAIYDFPFTGAGFPSRLTGRAAILDFLASTWATGLVSYERYETIAAYRTVDPGVIIVEQDVDGTSPASGRFTLPNLVIAEVRDNRIRRLRDYANLLAASHALGLRI